VRSSGAVAARLVLGLFVFLLGLTVFLAATQRPEKTRCLRQHGDWELTSFKRDAAGSEWDCRYVKRRVR
jgi:hypothetical protein